MHDYRFSTFIEFFLPSQRIMDAKKYYLDLFKKTTYKKYIIRNGICK